MNDDEAESSRARERFGNTNSETSGAHHDDPAVGGDREEDIVQREQRTKERRLDAKRKRVVFVERLLRDLDTLVFLQLITLYHLDCSFFWFVIRAIVHASLLTPLPDMGLNRQHDEYKPYLPLVLFCFAVNFLLHLAYPAPSAGEDTRGYLHGGLMIDFIGQEGPTSKWKLAALDICLLVLQLAMVSVHVKRRELKKKLAKMSGGSAGSRADEAEPTSGPTDENAAREQDADSEERGILRRTDTLSDVGVDPDEEDALLPSPTGHHDALDLLHSGQCVIGDFTLIDTLLQEHDAYQNYRQTRADTGASSSIPPSTLRQLHTIRVRFGVGGG